MKEEKLTEQIIGAAIEVHRALGPGLLESVYEECMAIELGLRGVPFERQKAVEVTYKGNTAETNLRLDLLVDDRVVVEIKAIERQLPVHEAQQLLSYLRLAGCQVGLLINFTVPVLKDGVKRMVLGPKDSVSPCLRGERGGA